MKIVLSLLFVLFVNTAIAQAAYEQNLINLATISFPAIPESHRSTSGDYYYLYKNNNNQWWAVVNYLTKSKSEKFKSGNISELYLSEVNAIIRRSGGTLLNKKEIEIRGLKAIEFEYSYKGKQKKLIQGKQQMVYLNGAMITIHFDAGSPDASYNSDNFFNSFTIASDKPALKPYRMAPANGLFGPLVFGINNFIYWSENTKLQWSDFKGADQSRSTLTLISRASTRGTFLTSANISADTISFTAVAVFDPRNSWVTTGYETYQILAHEQLHFDIFELFCRKLKKAIAEKAPFKKQTVRDEINKLEKQIRNQCFANQTIYDREAYKSERAQEEWISRVSYELKSLDAYKSPIVKVHLVD